MTIHGAKLCNVYAAISYVIKTCTPNYFVVYKLVKKNNSRSQTNANILKQNNLNDNQQSAKLHQLRQ